jgi:hypothetical protein
MIESPVKDTHFPDLHLPDSVTNFEWPKFEMPSVDVGKAVSDAKSAVSDAASGVHIGRPKRRSRLPFAVVGLVAAGLVGWIVLSQESIRARIAGGSRALREQIAAVRTGWARGTTDHDDAVAFQATETAPMETSTMDDGHASDYPTGLGSNNGNEDLPLKKTKVRA